jgi:hypothetical protein
MDKREFIQRYIIENFDNGNIYRDIETAVIVFDAIEETMAKAVSVQNLWDYNDK